MRRFLAYNREELRSLAYIILKFKMDGQATMKQLYYYIIGKKLTSFHVTPRNTRGLAWLMGTHQNLEHKMGIWTLVNENLPLNSFEKEIFNRFKEVGEYAG